MCWIAIQCHTLDYALDVDFNFNEDCRIGAVDSCLVNWEILRY